MRRIIDRGVLALCLLCLGLSLSVPSLARYGRDFAGTYQVTNVSGTATSVHLTLTVKIVNYSGANISNGAVALYDQQPKPAPLGGYPAIPLFQSRQMVTLTGQFDVPRAEYEHWKIGGQPNLLFLSQGNGMVRMRSIQLSRSLQGPTEK